MILKKLRNETSRHHDDLERQLPLLSAQLTLAEYQGLLLRFYGYYKPLETRLASATERERSFFKTDGADKSRFLEQDLILLGASTTDELKRMPKCADLPPLETVPHVLGCLYVLEGATLGGQIITAHLETQLCLTPQSGAAFFHGYGKETGHRWQAFGIALRAEAQKLDADDAIVENANRTFETMARWLFPRKEAAN